MKYKKSITMLLTGVSAAIMASCGQTQEQMHQKVDSAMKINHDIDSVYQMLTYSFESYMPANMDAALDGMKTYLMDAGKRLDAVEVPSKELQKAIGDKIEMMKQLAVRECAEQVRLYKISEVEFTESNRKEWDSYAEAAAKKMAEANSKVNNAYSKISK